MILKREHFVTLALVLSLLALVLMAAAKFAEAWLRRRRQDDEQDDRQWCRRVADASFDGLLIHQGGAILQANHALVRMLGCREAELLGQNFAMLARPDQSAALRAELEAPRPQPAAFVLLRPDKAELAVEISSHSIEHERRPATVTAIRDISGRLADAARIAELTHYDSLTGLCNRKLFFDRLVAAIAQHDHQGGSSAVLAIDLDQFKSVNEQIGRAGGDQLLKQVAARIGALTGEADTLGRISGDKFAVVLAGAGTPNRVVQFAGALEASFNQPFMVDGQLVQASLSIGIAVYPDHAADADGLLKASDFALKQARRGGGGFSHMFSHEEADGFRAAAGRDMFRIGLTKSQRLSQDLRNALAGGEIKVVYQPIFSTADLALVGYEALARWHHRKDGLIGPAVFIPLAEQAGLIQEIGNFVLETACAEAAARPSALIMAVNLSPLQFRDMQLPDRISAVLRKTGLAPARLELEVTESLLIENSAAAIQALRALRAIGVSVALDDFGTGYSSLSYLCDYPFARLKIDKRFVQAVGEDANADAIVTAILSLARNLRLEVTAEGVETAAQLEFLTKSGCPQVQGFLLGRPGAQGAAAPPALAGLRHAASPALVPSRA